ncbi:uncharacterized protein MELLADRAFT_58857 [Melampsora larici-populina 98AG31]|uniref:Uncharacterized protein n=1 Tax=Melampsora larici-populina (strain 98AG31 / pathotype 3-4-7) TaxID=747676 RepID=F4R669_MELLP|nr:uncharacterized protein MELLADRAFT_58857 [Melampsora larici-populina 98AG31]EGG12520.1 hypothetical protein MELLADRAFT_58857 [Melampsora larici-populina 98AG31]
MTDRTSRKKAAIGEKDNDNNSVKNMLVSNQGDQSRNSGSNQNSQGITDDTGNKSQVDSEISKNLGSSTLHGNSKEVQSVTNQGDINNNNVLDSNLLRESEKRDNKTIKNPVKANPIVIEDLIDDLSSQKSNDETNVNLLDVNSAFKQIPVMKSTPKKAKNQVKSIERCDSDSQIVNATYLDLLRSQPKSFEKDQVVIEKDGKTGSEIDLTDKNEVFKKAMSLTVEGDGYGASKYLKIYEALGHLDKHQERPSNKQATSANPILEETHDEKKRDDGGVFENGMWFFPGRTSTYKNRSYTPYFDRNIKELRYPIPLTIFDNDWQTKAMGYHAKKKIKSVEGELKTETYTGLPYADKWLLDYGEWCIHYNGYINALTNARFKKFVEWSLAHKANVEKVMALMGWLTALKYDIRVREESLINRVEVDGHVAPPDISGYNQALAEECFLLTRSRGKVFHL